MAPYNGEERDWDSNHAQDSGLRLVSDEWNMNQTNEMSNYVWITRNIKMYLKPRFGVNDAVITVQWR